MKVVTRKIKDGHLIEVDDATSRRMARIRRQDTKPELLVRQALHAVGHRFRVGNRDLPGSPDIANRTRKWAVFVHGCYWHRHGCKATTTPGRNVDYWEAKFRKNIERDRRKAEALRGLGYKVVVVWECETKRTSFARVVVERLSFHPRDGHDRVLCSQ